jgi:sugar phosphate isomerase/epimerase
VHELGYHCNRLNHPEDRVLANGLKRGEFYNFPPDDLPALKRSILLHNIAMSIHSPLVKPQWYPDPPTWTFLCDVDEDNRQLTLRMVEGTMELAEEFGAEYVVVHFPAPSTVDTTGFSPAKLREIALDSCERLAELSQKHNIPIHVEGFGPSPFLDPTFLIEVITQFPVLRYCWDSAHMYISAQRDGFDYYEFAERLAPYLGSIHLWNTRGMDDYLAFRHIPVHPSQTPEKGWVDIPRLLRIVGRLNYSCPIIFESVHRYPEALGDHDYRDGVKWVKELVATLS